MTTTNPSPSSQLHPPIRGRWSPRVFSSELLSEEQLRTLFEAAQWAPSCFNEQPWRFIVATRDKSENFERLLACLAPANQEWAKDCPALVLSVTSTTFALNGEENRHAWHDVGLASAQLVIQATTMGLHAHFMAGFDGAAARSSFQIPEGFEPVTVIAIGRRPPENERSQKALDEEKAPRKRKSLDEIVFEGRWDSSWSPK